MLSFTGSGFVKLQVDGSIFGEGAISIESYGGDGGGGGDVSSDSGRPAGASGGDGGAGGAGGAASVSFNGGTITIIQSSLPGFFICGLVGRSIGGFGGDGADADSSLGSFGGSGGAGGDAGSAAATFRGRIMFFGDGATVSSALTWCRTGVRAEKAAMPRRLPARPAVVWSSVASSAPCRFPPDPAPRAATAAT